MPTHSRRAVLGLVGAGAGAVLIPGAARAAPPPLPARIQQIPARIQQIMDRPAFQGATWGMAFAAADTGETVYAVRPDELFVPASSFKVFVAGTAFEALGAGHRFHTRVYGTGPVVRGVLRGDLVLVAGGDLLLSGRVRPDGTLLLPDPDPTYPGGAPLPDPLREIRDLAAQVRAAGVRRVEGRVRVDASLFPQARESIFLGNSMITVSPMMINDHAVHAVVTPGGAVGEPAVVRAAPATGHVRFTSQVTTVAASGPVPPPALGADVENPDGSHTVAVTGAIPLGAAPRYVPYFVPSPTRFAATVLAEALHGAGIAIRPGASSGRGRGVRLASRVSAPLSEQVKPMLKASSNVHTVTFPHLVGGVTGTSYEDQRQALFRAAGLEPDSGDTYSPNTFTRFLSHVARRPYFVPFHRALPIMGRDGTLAGNQQASPAAGHVYAKTGTGMLIDSSGGGLLHKALAGYVELPDGRWLTFAQFMRQSTTAAAAFALGAQAQEAMAEICTAVYETLGRNAR